MSCLKKNLSILKRTIKFNILRNVDRYLTITGIPGKNFKYSYEEYLNDTYDFLNKKETYKYYKLNLGYILKNIIWSNTYTLKGKIDMLKYNYKIRKERKEIEILKKYINILRKEIRLK